MKHVFFRRNALALFALLVLPSLAACGGGEGAADSMDARREAKGEKGLLQFVLDADQPISQGSNDLHLTIDEIATAAPFSGATVEVSARMPAMGHAAAVPTIEETGGGAYVVHGLALPMAGRWEIHVVASRAGTRDDTTITYDIP